ncbi:LafF [Pseudoalteromonas sp. 3J6]|uniref:flagellar basal body-associated FliL family protein n=1 Tax=unclassified Pseudoalteromonas TaxID=194690 RepID=UPI00110B6206|nr:MULTISPECIES: flagellar basal body-associated FliL family protein [unclassified Pseudoalteromonas]NWL15712.1 flagellar basal body-associated FliL family protein [Pseudoalteromonas sp. Scap03]MDN3484789.1 flagellar basal body-associated FliL family protein [Pseudoalteromonas sp. APC 3224]QLE80856.1 flagellar basal body-associated FliL family protein [Pseudoalteromonas sp. Scap25]QLE88799.1 flagellar basal body-associated FliL family protein [Pseudoalteromonas sp. Scap06]TMP70332.1 LafF [Pseu
MKKIIIALTVIVLIASAFFAGQFFNGSDSSEEGPQADITKVEYHQMERFIISVSEGSVARYLVLDLVLVTSPSIFNTGTEAMEPLVRNVLVKQFANMSHSQVKEAFKDIDAIQKDLLEQFNVVLANAVSVRLDNVLVTNVFIQ